MTTVISFLDGYCERAGDAGLFAEPLNAVTNLFFILAAILAGRALWKLRGTSEKFTDLWLLVAALFLIGIGSSIWHMYPTQATVLMDVVPITIFIHIYLIATMRRALLMRWPLVILWWSIYFAASIIAQIAMPPHLLHGSILYIPTYITLIILTAFVWRKDAVIGKTFLKMLVCWTAALTFRTIDLDICSQFHWGTHFLWHTLNAWMLYRFLMVYVKRPTAIPA